MRHEKTDRLVLTTSIVQEESQTMMRILTGSIAANGSLVLSNQNQAGSAIPPPGAAGIITDVELILEEGSDSSIDVSFIDASGAAGNNFAVTGVDAQSVLQYKGDNAAIKRNSVIGKLTVTVANMTNSTLRIRVFIQE
jgi:hypothetical protein